MGNVCYKEIYYHKPKTQGRSLLRFQCFKCGDPNCVYGCGNYSDRLSCRNHLFNKDGICVHCNCSIQKKKYGCYHVKKQCFFEY